MLSCDHVADLASLYFLRFWIVIVAVWGLAVMWRLRKRSHQIDFPIVPPAIVVVASIFLAFLFAVTTWLLVSDLIQSACNPNGLTILERTLYGSGLAYSLASTLWIINVGTRSFRRGPNLDNDILESIADEIKSHDTDPKGRDAL